MLENFPNVQKAEPGLGSYPTFKVPAAELLTVVKHLKDKEGFGYLDMATAVDWKGPVSLDGYVRDPNPNPYLPDGIKLELEAPVANPKVQYRDAFELVYILSNLDKRQKLCLKVEVPRSAPAVPSLAGVFKAADWQEREAFDLFGIQYEGHPNLKKILTPEFTQGHPLRKDYVHVKDKYD